jgi:hypothetical protein
VSSESGEGIAYEPAAVPAIGGGRDYVDRAGQEHLVTFQTLSQTTTSPRSELDPTERGQLRQNPRGLTVCTGLHGSLPPVELQPKWIDSNTRTRLEESSLKSPYLAGRSITWLISGPH